MSNQLFIDIPMFSVTGCSIACALISVLGSARQLSRSQRTWTGAVGKMNLQCCS